MEPLSPARMSAHVRVLNVCGGRESASFGASLEVTFAGLCLQANAPRTPPKSGASARSMSMRRSPRIAAQGRASENTVDGDAMSELLGFVSTCA